MRRSLILLAVPALALSLAACRGQAPAAKDSAEQPVSIKIMVGGLDKVIYLPAKLTEQLGYFKEAGVDVSLLSEPSGAQAETVMLAGEVDGVVGFYDHTVDLQAKDKCVTSVVQFADVPGEAEMVAADKAATLTSAKDFTGRKLGVTSPGSSTDFLTRGLAVRNGVDPSKYTTVKAGAGSTFLAAIDNGGIDAGMTTDPTIAKLTNTGKAKVLVDMRTKEGTRAALGGLYPGSSLYMPCDFVAAHKQTIQKMANAFVRTLAFINTHSAAEIAAKMPTDFAGSEPKLYEQAINDSKGMFTADGLMPADGPKTVLDVLKASNEAVKAKADKIDLKRTFTTEFVKAAH
ncbi:nitrate ABC transporter substrate-binding protein [Longispora fulva]|uniref:NitT/TauT family transport system substrate-binding protein n=1 Tax=Longispora fulva TaxID=619741 RepID=A0A8J7GFB6_9ACTN|nr:ABC transporter substrate-binding protein [Longispora fulva]MBG6136825.1 NitT/TauT family transport system substrate-binding protein [Longispora fulva]GIG59995.1 nitrate ABC transporter substrate-binding protein [Longispora fulva]